MGDHRSRSMGTPRVLNNTQIRILQSGCKGQKGKTRNNPKKLTRYQMARPGEKKKGIIEEEVPEAPPVPPH